MKQRGPFEGRETMQVTDTTSFQRALESDTAAAEAWLLMVRENPGQFPGYDERWMDHREREVFRAYCEREDWEAAARVANASIREASRSGRLQRLEELRRGTS